MQFKSNQKYTKVAIIAAISVFSTQFGVTVIVPLLGWWQTSVGASFFITALIFSAFTIVCIPLSITGGIISDKAGRKPLITAGLLLYAVASFLFPFSSNGYGWIFVRALQGAGAGLFFPAITALLSEVTSSEERGHAMSIYNIGLGVGLAVGPISGGFLFQVYGIHMPFFFCVAFAILSIVLVLLFVHEPKERLETKRGGLSLNAQGRRILTFSCVTIFFGIGAAAIMGALFASFASESIQLPEWLIGAILSVMFAVFAILQIGFNRLMKRIGEFNLSITGLVLCACGLVLLYHATTVLELFIMSVFLGTGLAAISLGTLTLATKAAGGGERGWQEGKVMGIYYTMFYAGLGCIPLVCGAFSDIFGTRLLFLGYAALLFVLVPVMWMTGVGKNSSF